MKSRSPNRNLSRLLWTMCALVCACLSASVLFVGQEPTTKPTPAAPASSGPGSKGFDTPQDRQRAADFAAEAREKQSVSLDPKKGNRAFVTVGNENWPFPVPIVKRGDKWHF